MKSIIAACLLFLFSLMGFAQQVKEVPKVVSEALENQYPTAKVKSWEKSGDNFVANVKDEGQNGKVEITSAGEWVQTTYNVDGKEVPGPILTYLKENYPANYKISAAEFHEKSGTTSYYFIKTKKEGVNQDKPSELTFSSQGALINKFDPTPIKMEESTTENSKANKTKESKTKETKVKETKEKETKVSDDEEEDDKSKSKNKTKSSSKEKSTNKESNTSKGNTASKGNTTTKGNTASKGTASKKKVENLSVSESLIPAKVRAIFGKKFPRATEAKWDTLPNDQFGCSFVFHEQKTSIKMDTTGAVLVTKTQMTEANLYQPLFSYLDKKFDKYKIVYAEKVVRSDKNNYYFVKISVKKKGIYQIYFDKSGRLDKLIEPDAVEEKEVEETTSSLDNKFNSEYEKELSKGIDESVATESKINVKELPTPIMNYIKKTFPADYKIKKSMSIEDPDFGLGYFIKVGKEGVKQAETQLFFDSKGELIKSIGPNDNESVVKEDAKTEEKEEKSNIPSAVIQTLKGKYAKAAAVKWETEDTLCSATFQYNGMKYKVDISLKGNWIQTTTPVKEESVPSFITSGISKTMKTYKIMKCESIQKADKKNMFYVEVSEKKKPTKEDPITKFYFSASGKLIKKLGPGESDE